MSGKKRSRNQPGAYIVSGEEKGPRSRFAAHEKKKTVTLRWTFGFSGPRLPDAQPTSGKEAHRGFPFPSFILRRISHRLYYPQRNSSTRMAGRARGTGTRIVDTCPRS